MPRAERGDVWLVDLGLAAKVRPCLVLNVEPMAQDRALLTVIPHTTSVRQSRFEVSIPVRFLKSGAFDAQNVVTIPRIRLIRRLGRLDAAQMTLLEQAVRRWLGL